MKDYTFRRGEPAAESFRRAFRLLIEKIREVLPTVGETPEAVHEIRKAVKGLRALVDLAAGAEGDELQRKLRKVGRQFGPLREAHVVRTVWTEFAHLGQLPAFHRHADVQVAFERYLGPAEIPDGLVHRVSEALAPIEESWTDLSLPEESDAWFERNLRHAYRRGHKRAERKLASARAEELHELRKKSKRTQYHLELLQTASPLRLRPDHKAWKKLGELLGRHHDLALFREILTAATEGEVDDTPLDHAVQNELKRVARKIARVAPQVYAEQPRAFSERLCRYWTLWQKQRQLAER